MRGQISFEYLMLIAFAIAILLPGALLLYGKAKASNVEIAGAQYELLGQELLSTAREAMSQGPYSWLVVKANIPENIIDIKVESAGRELVITYQTEVGPSVAVFFADTVLLANGTGSSSNATLFVNPPHPGRTDFRLTVNQSGHVLVTEWLP